MRLRFESSEQRPEERTGPDRNGTRASSRPRTFAELLDRKLAGDEHLEIETLRVLLLILVLLVALALLLLPLVVPRGRGGVAREEQQARDLQEALARPALEPLHGALLVERRVALAARAKLGRAHVHHERHVQIGAHALREEARERAAPAHLRGLFAQAVQERLELLLRVEAHHLTCRSTTHMKQGASCRNGFRM